MKSLLYVSRRSEFGSREDDIDNIVDVSQSRNAALDVTGALVATPHHFAQIIEGPTDAIDALMTSIIRDRRHFDIVMAPSEQRDYREFVGWSLIYQGDSTYVSELIANLIGGVDFDIERNALTLRSLFAMLALVR